MWVFFSFWVWTYPTTAADVKECNSCFIGGRGEPIADNCYIRKSVSHGFVGSGFGPTPDSCYKCKSIDSNGAWVFFDHTLSGNHMAGTVCVTSCSKNTAKLFMY